MSDQELVLYVLVILMIGGLIFCYMGIMFHLKRYQLRAEAIKDGMDPIMARNVIRSLTPVSL